MNIFVTGANGLLGRTDSFKKCINNLKAEANEA